MQTEPTHSSKRGGRAAADPVTVCPNCRTQMPSELRFCRACGFRLGEGVAEFTETVRFQNPQTGEAEVKRTGDARAPETAAAPNAAAAPKWYACGNVNEWGALAIKIGEDAAKIGVSAARSATQHFDEQRRKKQRPEEPPAAAKHKRSNWMGWLILIIIISVISSGGFRGASGLRDVRDKLRNSLRELRGGGDSSASRSWFGSSEFKTIDDKVTFDKVEPWGAPADKAGLVGGDLIETFDGQAVKNAGEFRNLLSKTPIGKTVEVVYLRDGEIRKTNLVTVSKD